MVFNRALILVLLANSADAFSTTSMTRQSSSATQSNNKQFKSLSMAAGGEDDPIKITSVNSKEIFFDEKTGRFFETKQVADEQKQEVDVSGPFKRANPLAKPEGTFFDQFKKGGDEAEPSVPAPVSAAPPSPVEEKAPLFGGFFQQQDETPQPAAPAPPAPVEKSVDPTPAKEAASPFSFMDNMFKEDKAGTEAASPFSFMDNLFQPKEDPSSELEEVPGYDEVTISPDFRVAAAFVGAGLLLDQIPYIQLTLGPIVTLLGILFLVQSFRIRFVFTETNELQLESIKNPITGEREGPGENVVVGGANRWACDKIVNYDFFPPIDSSPVGPVLVYFKETQTPSEFWNDGPGAIANSGEGKVKGQVHFFPAVCSAEQINEEFAKRGCGKL